MKFSRFSDGEVFDQEYRLLSPSTKKISNQKLAGIRTLIAVYISSTLIVGYSWQARNISATYLKDVNIESYLMLANHVVIGRTFSYFTWLCLWSQTLYFLITSFYTWQYSRYGKTWLHKDAHWICQIMHEVWYTTVTTFPILVSVVFWGTMYSGPWPKGRYEQWLNISAHGLNSLFAIVEICLPATKRPPIWHLGILAMFQSLYLGLAYLTKATQGWYVYAWLDPQYGWVSIVLHILGYAGGMLAIFGIVNLILWFKEKKMPKEEAIEKSLDTDV